MKNAKLISETTIDRNPPRYATLDRAELAVAGFALAALLAAVAVIGAIMAASCGCVTRTHEEEWRELIAPHLAALSNKLDQASAILENPVAQGVAEGSKAPSAETDAISFESLKWRYGGFDGSRATPVSGCEIAELRVVGGKMSYRWSQGGCELLGAADRGDANCIAALFVQGADGSWRGGKFDWISTSRTSRSFENIHGEYHGWPSDSIEKAAACAFVIVSKDGKRRSNVIMEVK